MVTTPGASNADSWATEDDLEAYEATRLPRISGFSDLTCDEKEAILLAGCREIEACFEWNGSAASSTQSLTWPRSGMLTRTGYAIPTNINPQELKNAQCEFGLQLHLSNRLSDNDPLKKGITSIKAGSVALTFSDVQGGGQTRESADVAVRKQQSDLNYVSDVVPNEVRRLLVPSWFKQNSISRPLVFEAY
jgi:hypothetical protein